MAGIRLYKGYSKKNFRVGVVKPLPLEEDKPIVFTAPYWVSSGDLGTFVEDGSEIFIQLEYVDSDGIISEFFMFESLPNGLRLNQFDGSISGVLAIEESATYNFKIYIRTIQNAVYEESFSISTIKTSNEIVWETDQDLGLYNSGESVNTPISAKVVTVQQ